MRILIDMDGIIVDLLGKWLDCYNHDFNDCLSVDMVDSWHIAECIKPQCSPEKMMSYIHRPGFFSDLKPLPGAIDGVKAIMALGHDVKFATAPCNADSAKCKIAWLDYHFNGSGLTGLDSFICQDKHWIDADLLIDDKPETLARWDVKGCLTATIEYPYNAHLLVDCMASSCTDTEAAWEQLVAFVERVENVIPIRRAGR